MTTPYSKVGLLGNVRMFSSLDEAELTSLARASELSSATAGTEIVSEGEMGDEFYLIVSGVASVLRGGRFVATLGSGSHFGEIALFDRGPRTATVVADTDCELMVIPQQHMMDVIVEVPTVAQKLLSAMAAQLREVASKGAYWGTGATFSAG